MGIETMPSMAESDLPTPSEIYETLTEVSEHQSHALQLAKQGAAAKVKGFIDDFTFVYPEDLSDDDRILQERFKGAVLSLWTHLDEIVATERLEYAGLDVEPIEAAGNELNRDFFGALLLAAQATGTSYTGSFNGIEITVSPESEVDQLCMDCQNLLHPDETL